MTDETTKIEELTPPDTVDYFIYRTDIAREQRHTAHWRAAAIVVFTALVVAICWYIWHESQYETVSVEQTVTQTTDQGGENNNTLYTGDYYGNADGEDNGQDTRP